MPPRPVSRRLVARRGVHGHWECHAEGGPATAATGERPAHALARLCELLGLSEARYAAAETGADRVLYEDRGETPFDDPCPDCGGTGEYVGLNVVERCGTCGGKGRVPW